MIGSELGLARLAIDLGAETTGGPLAYAERVLIVEAKRLPISTTDMVEAARPRILAGGDPLGDVFCVLRSPVERRDQGQFWTPPAILEPMVAWAVDHGCCPQLHSS